MILALLQVSAALSPSFDCTRARTQVEHAICSSNELAELDREEARLYRIALAVAPARRQQLTARQRDFLKDRNSCPESAAPLGECVRDSYLHDIGDLRRVAELQDDNEGLSRGPYRFRCNGGYPDVYVTLFDLEPAQADLSVPKVNESQPLVADFDHPDRLAGRYATEMVYDMRARRVTMGGTTCTPAP